MHFRSFSIATLLGSFVWSLVLAWFGARVLGSEPRLLQDPDALMHVLKTEVIPLFYSREDGVPRGWIARMKRAIHTLGWRFSADRMVMDYVMGAYIPAAGGTSCDLIRF